MSNHSQLTGGVPDMAREQAVFAAPELDVGTVETPRTWDAPHHVQVEASVGQCPSGNWRWPLRPLSPGSSHSEVFSSFCSAVLFPRKIAFPPLCVYQDRLRNLDCRGMGWRAGMQSPSCHQSSSFLSKM